MIGNALKIIRVFNDQTQKELADKLGISHSYLSQIESGKRNPTLETIRSYSEHFGIPVSSLMFFSEQISDDAGTDNAKRLAFGRKILGTLERLHRVAAQP